MNTGSKILSQLAEAEKQISENTALKEKLKSERDSAVSSGAVDDEACVGRLQTINTKLSLIPARTLQLDEKFARLVGEAEACFQTEVTRVSAKAAAVASRMLEKATAGLQPFCADVYEARNLAGKCTKIRSLVGLDQLQAVAQNDPSQKPNPAGKLKFLIEVESQLDKEAAKYPEAVPS